MMLAMVTVLALLVVLPMLLGVVVVVVEGN